LSVDKDQLSKAMSEAQTQANQATGQKKSK